MTHADALRSTSDERSSSGERPLLVTRTLGKSFRGVTAVDSVELSIQANEIVGVIGPNGAGKTTVFNLVAGTLKPSRGRVRYKDRDVTRLSAHYRRRLGISRTFQLIRPFVSLSVYENVHVAATAVDRGSMRARRRTDDVLQRLGLSSIAHRSAGSVNIVEGKRLEIARALVGDPSLILLDEVFAGLNKDEVAEMSELVRSMRTVATGVMLIEHNVGAIRSVTDRVLAMSEGRLICEGAPSEVLSDQHVRESYLGKHAGA